MAGEKRRRSTIGGLETEAVSGEGRQVERAMRGDRAAFDDLVRAHYRRVHSAAFHLVGNHEDAEDLTQECFVKAHRGLRWFRGAGSFAGWLRTILVHLARDRFRRAGRRPADASPSADEVFVQARGPVHEVGRKELGRLLAEAMRRLPDHLRVALVLRTREALTYDQISEATGVTPATARTQVMKARRALLVSMKPYLEGGEE